MQLGFGRGTCGQKDQSRLGESLMSGPRCDRMLAGTALALLLAAPFGVSAQEAAKSPAIASPATEASPPPAIPAGEPPTASINTDPAAPAAPAAVTETAAPDPLASLDPADRVVAERIRDLLAATPDKIFASKNESGCREILSGEKPRPALARQGHRKRTRQGCDCPP